MLSISDGRSFSTEDDRFARCIFCGKSLVVLPNDRRGGACFDCLSLLGTETRPCPACGTEISSTQRPVGCPRCGWSPSRD
jgi:DNA-directed RNA polymerase subunit RPC12/RpoP